MHLNCVTADDNQAKETYSRRGMVTIYFNNHDNTLAGSSKITYNANNHSNKVANIMKA